MDDIIKSDVFCAMGKNLAIQISAISLRFQILYPLLFVLADLVNQQTYPCYTVSLNTAFPR